MRKTPTWNVYRYCFNQDKIITYNIFDHLDFCRCIKKAIKKYESKEEYAAQLKLDLQYFFWAKAEHELIIEIADDGRIYLVPFKVDKNQKDNRIEMTDDTTFDWTAFARSHVEKQMFVNRAKIDVYDQIMYKWQAFVGYCWDTFKSKSTSN